VEAKRQIGRQVTKTAFCKTKGKICLLRFYKDKALKVDILHFVQNESAEIKMFCAVCRIENLCNYKDILYLGWEKLC